MIINQEQQTEMAAPYLPINNYIVFNIVLTTK